MDGYYGTRGHGAGAGYQPRNIQEQVDAIMQRLAGGPEARGATDDGMAHGNALPAPPPQPRNWREAADAIVAQLEREQAERSAEAAGDGGWPMTGYAEIGQAALPPASPSHGAAAYAWLRQEAYLQADKIRNDLGRYYRDATADPLGAIYSAAPSFGPYGAEAGQIAGAAGRAVNALGMFMGRNRPYPLSRAVGPSELADLQATGGVFRDTVPPQGIKYFAETPEAAASYARQAYGARDLGYYQGPYTIVETSISRRYLDSDMYVTVDRGIRSRVIPADKFDRLEPGTPLPYTPLSKRK